LSIFIPNYFISSFEFFHFDKSGVHQSSHTLRRAEYFAQLGIEENCGCVACLHNLSWDDIGEENTPKYLEMIRTGVFKEEVTSVRTAMEKMSQLFDFLNISISPESAERIMAYITIRNVFLLLRDRLMFPA
jgi:hypothetical protein